jgi:DNA repair protein RadC
MDKGLHDGHRERVKQRFRNEGLRHFETHQMIEMLLFYGIPRRDTNEIAHQLLNTFGSLSSVLEADYEELLHIKGMTTGAATLINFCGKLSQAYYEDKFSTGNVLQSTPETGAFLVPKFMAMKNEAVMLVCLDNRCKVLNCSVIFEGSVNAAEINVRLALQQALRYNATSVILAHNHPSGQSTPSQEDVRTTMTVAKALSMADIRLLDHIIVAGNTYTSMRDAPAWAPIFTHTWQPETQKVSQKRTD